MTIKEIAQLAGVSISTVSKVMNNKAASISPETKEKVLQIAKQFNYIPYSNTTTAVSKSFLIGVILSSYDAIKMAEGILDEAQNHSYQIISYKTHGNSEEEENAIAALCKHNVDAILWQSSNKPDPRLEKKLRCHNIPYLFLPSADDFYENCDVDFSQIGYMAAKKLLYSGHKNIGFLASAADFDKTFFKGYKKALFDQGLSYQDGYFFNQINDILMARIASGFISAIFIPSGIEAVRLYDILGKRHYQIPHDLSIITIKRDSNEESMIHQLSSVTLPFYELGAHMVRNLINLLEHGATPEPFQMSEQTINNISIYPPRLLQKKHMTVIGSINIDNYLTVNKLPVSGITSNVSNVSLYPGGKAVNIAIGVARLDAEVSILGGIGSDLDSDIIFSSLEDHGIMTNKLYRFSDVPTGKGYIFVQPDGESTISLLAGANSLLDAAYVEENKSIFQNCSFCLMQTEISSEPLVAAAKIAHNMRIPIILKPSSRMHLEPELLRCIDIIVPNQEELEFLTPDGNFEEKIQYFLDYGIKTVIVTQGENGCTLKTSDTEKHYNIPCSFISVDNTGAGDAFIAALAVYLDNGYTLDESIRIAMFAAGFCISREGVALSMIDKNTLESFIRKKDPSLLHN